nr:restriction endonuclease subunit S [Treponema phagedenis]
MKKSLSPRLEKLEKEFLENGGEWKSVTICKLFRKIKTKTIPYKARDLENKHDELFSLPALTAGVENQGLAYYVPRNNATILKNVISVSANGANTGVMFYQPYEFTVLQDSYAIEFKDKILTDKEYLFLLSALQKSIRFRFDWSNKAGWERIKNEKIELPFLNGNINFSYMEKFIEELEAERIEELEAERIEELEAYLIATGLKDYKLTMEDQKILDDFEKMSDNSLDKTRQDKTRQDKTRQDKTRQDKTRQDKTRQDKTRQDKTRQDKTRQDKTRQDKTRQDKIRLGNIFNIESPKKKFNANSIKFDGEYPYVARGETNNGIKGYITEEIDYLNNGNTISFGQDTATMFYQKTPYFTGDKIKILSPKIHSLDSDIALYYITATKKTLSTFSWGSTSYNVNNLENIIIELPIEDNKIDITFMKKFIKVVKKLIIKDVVIWADKKIEATKKVALQN